MGLISLVFLVCNSVQIPSLLILDCGAYRHTFVFVYPTQDSILTLLTIVTTSHYVRLG